MPRSARLTSLAAMLVCCGLAGPAFAQQAPPVPTLEPPSAAANEAAPQAPSEDDDNTRAVRIIDENTAPAAAAPPSAPSASAPPIPTFELGKSDIKGDNAAGLSIQMLPGAELQVGTRIAFRVTTKKPGYLILIDVDAEGKLTQVYPNRGSLLATGGREGTNLIKPGRVVTIPDKGNPLAGFEFVASPPNGVAMIVAILSDKPVQMIDLPDVPDRFAGRAAALEYLSELARSLRIPNASGALQEAKWSFDAKLYLIR